MKKLALLSSFALAAAVSPLLGQTILFQHDFSTSSDPDAMPSSQISGPNPGRLADTSVWNVYRANSPAEIGATTKYIEVTDANSPFGEGNQHLRLHYQGAAGTLWTTASNQFSSGSQVVTVQFDFFRPSTTSWGAPNTGGDPRLRLGVSDPVGSNNNRVSNQLFIHGNGSIAGVQNAYSFDTVHTVKWVYNYSTSQATYEDYPELTIDSNHFDVWLDGTRIVAGFNDGTSTPLAIGRELTSLGIMAGTAGVDVEMMFDNITVYAGAIPEPSTYAFGAGILALGAAWMWRRRRAA